MLPNKKSGDESRLHVNETRARKLLSFSTLSVSTQSVASNRMSLYLMTSSCTFGMPQNLNYMFAI